MRNKPFDEGIMTYLLRKFEKENTIEKNRVKSIILYYFLFDMHISKYISF